MRCAFLGIRQDPSTRRNRNRTAFRALLESIAGRWAPESQRAKFATSAALRWRVRGHVQIARRERLSLWIRHRSANCAPPVSSQFLASNPLRARVAMSVGTRLLLRRSALTALQAPSRDGAGVLSAIRAARGGTACSLLQVAVLFARLETTVREDLKSAICARRGKFLMRWRLRVLFARQVNSLRLKVCHHALFVTLAESRRRELRRACSAKITHTRRRADRTQDRTPHALIAHPVCSTIIPAQESASSVPMAAIAPEDSRAAIPTVRMRTKSATCFRARTERIRAARQVRWSAICAQLARAQRLKERASAPSVQSVLTAIAVVRFRRRARRTGLGAPPEVRRLLTSVSGSTESMQRKSEGVNVGSIVGRGLSAHVRLAFTPRVSTP